MKRAWAISCILALSAILVGCNKDKSHTATDASGASSASESQAAVQPASGASDLSAAGPATLAAVTAAQLPGEAAETLRLIKSGGPYPYHDDGVQFRNSAKLLPEQPRGYYRTYTVRTPGATDRGKRRIVCGGARKQTGECYYTDDYYASFKRIAG